MFPIGFINDDGEVQPFDLFNETTYRPTVTPIRTPRDRRGGEPVART
jgi:hypothetical protein